MTTNKNTKYTTSMFFWFGIYLFNSNYKEYGGFNHFIAYKIFRGKYTYMTISLHKKWKFKYTSNDRRR